MLKLRLAIISLCLCILLSALAAGFGEVGVGTLWTNYGLFSLVLAGTVVLTLSYPVAENPDWLKLTVLSVLAYLVLVFGFNYSQPGTAPELYLIMVQALSLFVIVPLSCWVSCCLTCFESSVYQLGLNHQVANIRDPESEANIQYMLMNSRYTGQSLGFISIDVSQHTREKLQTRLYEQALKNLAVEHWQTEISRSLSKDLRLTDKFYKQGSENRLLIMCPGLNNGELADLSAKLEHTVLSKAGSASVCHYVSFPDDSLTLEGLIERLDEKSADKPGRVSPLALFGRKRTAMGSSQKLETRATVEESD